MEGLLQTWAPPVLAAASALLIDRIGWRRGFRPPGFLASIAEGTIAGAWRRAAASTVLGVVLWVGVFAPLGVLGTSSSFDPSAVSTGQLFVLHAVLVLTVLAWYVLGFAPDAGRWVRQFGLYARRPLIEIALGVGAGIVAWIGVILVMVAVAFAVWAFGGQDLLPQSAPPLIPWLAGLPIALRLAVSVSAGVSEELFFRGFLQPRAGVWLSTGLFVLAHLTYDQPFMLLGVMLLSFTFAGLVRWRQNIWAAVAAHATFDAVQLTIMIPWALRNLESESLPVLGTLL